MSERHEIQLDSRPVLSHSADAVRAGGLVFVAGVLPVDADGVLVGGRVIAAQAQRVFADLGSVLEAAGSGLADIARMDVFLTDIRDAPAVAAAQSAALGGSRPAGATVAVRGLAIPGARIEVDATACLGGAR